MKAAPRPLRIAHVTDLHVDVRWDIFEERLKSVAPKVTFNNSNRSSLLIYADATRDAKADIVLMTGDLIDYGRGHRGLADGGKLGENKDYLRDRNWFLFQELLASGDRYTRPVYTFSRQPRLAAESISSFRARRTESAGTGPQLCVVRREATRGMDPEEPW